jgi:signal transduction histidine kinase
MLSRFFRPTRDPAGQSVSVSVSDPGSAPSPIEILTKRLEASLARPLLRIPAEDLPEEIRALVVGLNARLDALAAAEKEQQQFIADVSHELRTPLTILRGSLEVALEESAAEEYREAIGNALLEVRH